MPASQQHVTDRTPMGATLVPGGATFRVWAPAARNVYVVTSGLPTKDGPATWAPNDADLLARRDDGTWTGFISGIGDGSPYRFWIIGDANGGFKRDPYARELGTEPAFPDCDCLVRDPRGYPWHDEGYRPPHWRDLVVYQLHIGVFYAVDDAGRDVRPQRTGRFLDLLDRVEYLHELGVNAVLPLPIQEYPTPRSMGYNGTDYFSPEMDYQVWDAAELARYLAKANTLLAAHGKAALTIDELRPGPNQLKLIVDLCHLNGIAVLFDLVYNHAGGDFGDQSLYFFDRRPATSNNDSLYFTDQGWAGGLVFAYWNPGVRQFLIDNATFFLEEYHIDGIRYDEVSVIDSHGGWRFCQDLTGTVRYAKPQAIQIAEYWNERQWLSVSRPPEGMGFDATLADGLRDRLRAAIEQTAGGRDARVDLDGVGEALRPPFGFPAAWSAVQCVENHDLVLADRPAHERHPRVAALADPTDARSWYARSRARVAAGLLLTAPGIPMLFMGQEILEDKLWSDNSASPEGTLVWWDGLGIDRAMRDHLEFMRALVRLRRGQPALRGEQVNVFHVHDGNRVIAFHRWVEGVGDDVIVVASLNESTFWRYELGFPQPGRWSEVLNSDYYDGLPNPEVAGNGGSVAAVGPPMHQLPYSAALVLPANGVLVFARE
jgi:1,4-alpha-glucan branching enzyme